MEKPKVSVIVPVYNVEKYLEKSIDSLINQTLDEIEIIAVNDGSTDSSLTILKDYEEKYNNIKVYTKENGGLSDARNYGLKYANGDYIAFLDSDDYVDATLYEKMYNKAIEENADYVECDFIWEYPNENVIDTGIRFTNKIEMFTYGRVVAWNKLIKADLVINNENLRFPFGLKYEDVEFFYKLIPEVKKFAFVKEPLIHYVQREDSLVKVQTEKTLDLITSLNEVLDYYKNKKLFEEYQDAIEYTFARLTLCSSLKRMSKIEDNDLRDKCIETAWKNLNEKFPNWQKNKIIQNTKDERFKNHNKYLKTVNNFTVKIYGKFFKYAK